MTSEIVTGARAAVDAAAGAVSEYVKDRTISALFSQDAEPVHGLEARKRGLMAMIDQYERLRATLGRETQRLNSRTKRFTEREHHE